LCWQLELWTCLQDAVDTLLVWFWSLLYVYVFFHVYTVRVLELNVLYLEFQRISCFSTLPIKRSVNLESIQNISISGHVLRAIKRCSNCKFLNRLLQERKGTTGKLIDIETKRKLICLEKSSANYAPVMFVRWRSEHNWPHKCILASGWQLHVKWVTYQTSRCSINLGLPDFSNPTLGTEKSPLKPRHRRSGV